MTLEEFIEERRKRVANMTLAHARDLIAKTLTHSDMELEFDKAVWMLLECADKKINSGWIPVTEGLPKDGGDYLVTLSFDVGGKEPVREIRKNFYCILSKKWLYNNDDVTAWMPLPEPYEGGE